MRSIERRYEEAQKKNPELSSLINFGRAIKGQNFHPERIRKLFNKRVDKEDYYKGDKKEILKHLAVLNTPEAYQKGG